MDDRTLLERAAKAAGLQLDCTIRPDGKAFYHSDRNALALADGGWFAPLNDDGDALRLAVACGLSVTPYPIYSQPKHSVIAKRYEGNPAVYRGDAKPIEALEVYGSDPYAATRRAIVRAAAEIGGE